MTEEERLLEWIRMRLYERSRSLSLALGLLRMQLSDQTASLGSDGWTLYVNGDWLRRSFRENREDLCTLVLHVLCHCMLQHPFRYEREKDRILPEQWEEEAWKLLDEILPPDTDREQSLRNRDDHHFWERAGAGKEARVRITGSGPGSGKTGWGQSRQREDRARRQKCWEQARRQAAARRGSSGRHAGTRRMSVVQSLTLTEEKRYDYRSFLKRFSSLREEGGLDLEQFDYGFYFWGLNQYGNVPLIEPLEYRERRKIEELVIVIDTSGSCSRELVRMFLEETRNILKEEELFFRRFRLHIIQCDNQVQRDDRITSQGEMDGYLADLQVKGGGGTDFRPAFERIEQLRGKELQHLKGVLYFTDGYGIYPKEMPDYQVAFVFLKYRYDDIDVPGWAQKLVLDAGRPKGAEYEY